MKYPTLKKIYYFINPTIFGKSRNDALYSIEDFKKLFAEPDFIYPTKLLLWSDFAILGNKFIKRRQSALDGRFVSTESHVEAYDGPVVWHYNTKPLFVK